jgi:hypothetical protein
MATLMTVTIVGNAPVTGISEAAGTCEFFTVHTQLGLLPVRFTRVS